ncbi:hypothetical protein AALA44_00760 [Enterococcus ratti]|uniref:hypothetical protein n=1 Tax=Enterococcus ratti TaxID=150033 RepID=UPI0035176E23
MALRLGNAGKFSVVGEEGKKNYQLLFEHFAKMIEKDETAFFIDEKRKPEVIQSVKRTVDYYNTQNPKDLQNIIENLETDQPTSFMIIPSYVNLTMCDHMYGLILYKKDSNYIVTMIDKLGSGIGDSFCKGAFSTIPQERVEVLSELLFHIKFDHHKESHCNISSFIRKLGKEKNPDDALLALNLRSYRGVANCPVIEMLGTLRVALFNCKENIFDHKVNWEDMTRISPKLGEAKDIRWHLLNAFKGTNKEENQLLDHMWHYYLDRKKFTQALSEDHAREKREAVHEITKKYLKQFLDDSTTLTSFKEKQKEIDGEYKVFFKGGNVKLEDRLNEIVGNWQKAQQNPEKISQLVKNSQSEVAKKQSVFQLKEAHVYR